MKVQPMIDLTVVENVKWPRPWQPVSDEWEALSFGRRWGSSGVADTVLGELRREICSEHPLHGCDCGTIA